MLLKTLQKTLRKILTREEFVEKFYNKNIHCKC